MRRRRRQAAESIGFAERMSTAEVMSRMNRTRDPLEDFGLTDQERTNREMRRGLASLTEEMDRLRQYVADYTPPQFWTPPKETDQ